MTTGRIFSSFFLPSYYCVSNLFKLSSLLVPIAVSVIKDIMWSKLLHLTVDAVLVSTILAGVKRITGLQQVLVP